MTSRRRIQPRVEALEGRVVLSTIRPAMLNNVSVTARAPIHGVFYGTFGATPGAVSLTGQGSLNSRLATVSGSVSPGKHPGLLTLTTARGRLRLSLYPATQITTKDAVSLVQYPVRIVGGDGAFRGDFGYGTTYLAEAPATGGFALVFSGVAFEG